MDVISYHTQVFDAFTGMDPREKNSLIQFIMQNGGGDCRQNITSAIDYALKHKPSFGGFILTMSAGEGPIAALIANKTGMEGYGPAYIFVYVTFHEKVKQMDLLAQKLLKKAISCTDGEIAMNISPDHPALKSFKKIGFSSDQVGLRFSNTKSIVTT